jgi:DNA-binding NarL/FixJ family response regulator
MTRNTERTMNRSHRPPAPSVWELELLQALVDEPTMADVAARIGRSERHTRRLVRTLTNKLGVKHPRAAVALAVNLGWIKPPDGHCQPPS